jgi:flagellar biosynthesis/type III secretory pathway protein FliH
VPLAQPAFALEQLAPTEPPPAPGSPEEIVAEATAEAAAIRARAHAEGVSEGHARGMADVRSAAQTLTEAVEALARTRDELADAIERDAVELALALASKIVGATIEVEPERVLDAVAGALRRVVDRRQIAVFVDPEDLQLVSSSIDELRAKLGGGEICDVQADRRIGRGGVIVRSVEREVDATVATQLERAREVILAELGGGAQER